MVKAKPKKRAHVRRAVISEAIVSDADGILLLRRSTGNDLYVGKWQLPGGKVEKGETPLAAVKREILEETGCGCTKMKLIKKLVFNEPYKGRDTEVVLNVYSCRLNGSICLSDDHSKAKFVKKAKIKKHHLAPVSKKALFE